MNTAECEKIVARITDLLNRNVGMQFCYDTITNEQDFSNFMLRKCLGDVTQFVIRLGNADESLSMIEHQWSFDMGYEDQRSVIRETSYPWNICMNNVIAGYARDRISVEEVMHYFDLLDNSVDLLFENINKKFEDAIGSERFHDAINTYAIRVKNILNTCIRTIKVNDPVICFGSIRNKTAEIQFEFPNDLTYDQKKKFKERFDRGMLDYYQKVLPGITSIRQVNGFRMFFDDNNHACSRARHLTLKIDSNNWNAIGMSPEAAMIPRMGMHRRSAE